MKNWLTTLIGAGVGAGNLYLGGIHDWKNILVSVGFAILGAASKDYNKTNSPVPLEKAQATTTK